MRTLRRLRRVLIGEDDFELEQSTLPDSLLFARDTAIPFLEIHHAVGATHGFCEEAKGVVSSP